VILDLAPGQERTSLLLAPEGFLIPLSEIENAEQARIHAPPWCFVKTQFGAVEGHVLLVELLASLKREFFPDIEVVDEGGYWQSRDLNALRRQLERVQSAMDSLTGGLRKFGLSSEAAEDPAILAARIERIARQVHRVISHPAEHAPVWFDDETEDWHTNSADLEARWDAFYKENRRKQERLHRTIEERCQQGEDPVDALENAMRDEGIIDLPDESALGGDRNDFEEAMEFRDDVNSLVDACDDYEDDDLDDEPWKESLAAGTQDSGESGSCHPLLERAMDLMLRLHDVARDAPQETSHLSVLLHGGGEIMGGLAQALGPAPTGMVGLSVVQLKRALRGAAFAHGAIFPLRVEGLLDDRVFDQLRRELEELETEILAELARLRND
jgi:hypothetical protein